MNGEARHRRGIAERISHQVYLVSEPNQGADPVQNAEGRSAGPEEGLGSHHQNAHGLLPKNILAGVRNQGGRDRLSDGAIPVPQNQALAKDNGGSEPKGTPEFTRCAHFRHPNGTSGGDLERLWHRHDMCFPVGASGLQRVRT